MLDCSKREEMEKESCSSLGSQGSALLHSGHCPLRDFPIFTRPKCASLEKPLIDLLTPVRLLPSDLARLWDSVCSWQNRSPHCGAGELLCQRQHSVRLGSAKQAALCSCLISTSSAFWEGTYPAGCSWCQREL